MHERFFQLRQRPFAASPAADQYVPTATIEQARQSLVRCIDGAEGPGLVVGSSGIGKTLLCQLLAREFADRFQVALLSAGRLGTRRALLQNILFELKLPYREMDEGELRLSLIDHLEPRDAAESSEGLLIIVDEAHLLPLRLLDEIRLLTNLVRGSQPRVRLMLSGNPTIEERLASPKLESLQQRIATRAYLQPLNRDETFAYVLQQVQRSGGDANQLFTTEALQAVHAATDGIPRLINQVCNHALTLAALARAPRLDAAGIAEAWSDLQQLPAPWSDTPKTATTEPGVVDVLEFGELDEPVRDAHAVSTQAEHQLDRLDRNVAALRADFAPSPQDSRGGESVDRALPGDFDPRHAEQTEVELIFPIGADPFAGEWEEEEVVVDRYASLEARRCDSRHKVKSTEGRLLNQLLAEVPAAPPLSDLNLDDDEIDPASDPVMPESSEPTRVSPLTLHRIGDDDRDMIVVEEGNAAPARLNIREPKRQDYRRLFTSLRNR